MFMEQRDGLQSAREMIFDTREGLERNQISFFFPFYILVADVNI